ncbi:Predicted PurR-regulated permease PerM [Agreia bicolorata]|uniref:Predicted PurR-regulated permease PerM n=1 Tax=Agreia bicolorata TaxID=110935 RepID=A0A1T4YCM5_9MICO|nr:AI-2E family transporter [Agreia bicolorata]SKA99529.1 Predicted PurR-regulated permease PerM [Agreia bicolorata]
MSEPDVNAAAVPPGLRIAGAWSWRLLAIAGALGVFFFLVSYLRLLVIPLLVATLLSALLVPLKNWLVRHKWPKWLAIAVAELGTLIIVAALIYLVVAQVRAGFGDLRDQTIASAHDLRDWLTQPPFNVSDSDLSAYLNQALSFLQADSSALLSGAVSVGSTVTELFAGVLLTLFSTLFILIDGKGIWAWIVRIFPRRARTALDGAGKAGWLTLQNFIKVQILVATIDAIGIGAGAAILQLPLAIPIAVLVFLGSFIPVIGAVATGALAVFIALVYNGWVVALIMLGIVLLVQQVEGHVLQPLVMGTAVKVHPLAVVLAVAGGSVVAGIPGALFAVPIVAVLNVMIGYIARGDWRQLPLPTSKDTVLE